MHDLCCRSLSRLTSLAAAGQISSFGGKRSAVRSRLLLLCPAALIAASLLSGCASTAVNSGPRALQQQLQTDIRAAGLRAEDVALLVQPLTAEGNATGQVALNMDAPLQPASTIKLLTSAAALELLGARWQAQTTLMISAADTKALRQPAADGRVAAPVYLRGGGDPDLDFSRLYQLLEQLYAAGARELSQGFVLDRSLFTPELPVAPPFDEAPRARYNYVPDALGLNQQMLLLQLSSDDRQVRVASLPQLRELQIEPRFVLTDQPCQAATPEQWHISESVGSRPGTVLLTLSGNFPRHCDLQFNRAWLSHQSLWQLALSHYWQALGGRFGKSLAPAARVQRGVTPADAMPVAQVSSRPLPALIQQLNKYSDNGIARLLALQLAVQPESSAPAASAGASADTSQHAAELLSQWLHQTGIRTQGLQLDNGSGLSRTTRISPRQLAAVLQYSSNQPWWPELLSSLPRAGVDGTLSNRLTKAGVADRARLKTGTLRDATALAGIVYDSRQQPWIFVAMVNAPTAVTQGRPLLDKWVEAVTAF